jgi:hypothetical protein
MSNRKLRITVLAGALTFALGALPAQALPGPSLADPAGLLNGFWSRLVSFFSGDLEPLEPQSDDQGRGYIDPNGVENSNQGGGYIDPNGTLSSSDSRTLRRGHLHP